MKAQPITNTEALGTIGLGLLCLYLFCGVVFFVLSFSKRHGRSRWPLHLLLATCGITISTGMILIGLGIQHSIAIRSDPEAQASNLSGSEMAIQGGFWFGSVGLLLGIFAAIRATYGMIREPGPRY